MSDVNVSVTYGGLGLSFSQSPVTLPVTIQTVSSVQDEDSQLIGWAASAAYTLTSATRDSDGVITTATVAWPDSSTGTFTRTTKNSIWLVIDAYTVTHSASGKTITQSAVTRDANGKITVQPSLTVA
jgi:hypothetical protein